MSEALRVLSGERRWSVDHGDCLEFMLSLPDCCLDSMVTDPPYEIFFSQRKWDGSGIAYNVEVWREVLRILKPGAYLLVFGGCRTSHRVACAIEDAGFEIRDSIAWHFASGMPKSLSISKAIDEHDKNICEDTLRALAGISTSDILAVWIEHSSRAPNAGLSFLKQDGSLGRSTQKNDSVREHVAPPVNPRDSHSSAIAAELTSVAHRLKGETDWFFAPSRAGVLITESRGPAINVERAPENQDVLPDTTGSFAQCLALGCPEGSTAGKTTADEALKIWLGRRGSSVTEDTDALCAALTNDLRLTILSQSETFRSLDTTHQMDCAFATTVTITESTAESLISFTVDTLRRKSAAGANAQREIVRSYTVSGNAGTSTKDKGGTYAVGAPNSAPKELHVTRGASERSRKWDGYGTNTKPTFEPIIVARKPLDGTVAQNVQKWGVGALNIDGCRVAAGEDYEEKWASSATGQPRTNGACYGDLSGHPRVNNAHEDGRFPPNAIFQHSPKCSPDVGCVDGCPVLLMDQQSGEMQAGVSVVENGGGRIFNGDPGPARPNGGYQDEGSASRIFPQIHFEDGLEFPPFLYHPKANRAERDRGLERFQRTTGGEATGRKDGSAGVSARAGAGRTGGIRNIHPTVKAIGLIRWLQRLVTPAGGITGDIFLGSGTAGCAAMMESFRFIGCELNDTDKEPFVRIARARIAAVLAHDWTVVPEPNEHERQQSLFEVAS